MGDHSRLCDDEPTPGAGIKDTRTEREQKDRFSIDDIKKIFDPENYKAEKLGESWRYWVPLLGIYSGGRLEELSHLRMADVFQEGGIVALKITTEAGHLKTKSSDRIVPIHSKLIELGFLDFVTDRHVKGVDKLFPRLWNTKNGPGDKCGRWFNRTFLQPFKLDGKKTFHSFRHTLRDELYKKLIDERVINEITGHKQLGIGATTYSKGLELETLRDAIEQIDYGI